MSVYVMYIISLLLLLYVLFQDITPSKLLGNVEKAKSLNQLSTPKG